MLVKLHHETPRFGVEKKYFKPPHLEYDFFSKLSLLVFRAYRAYQTPGFFGGDWIPRDENECLLGCPWKLVTS